LALVVAAALSVEAASVCLRTVAGTAAHDPYLSTDADAVALRAKYHKWQTDKWATFKDKKLGELFWPGSHDASTYNYLSDWGYAAAPVGTPTLDTDVAAVTQRFSLLDQLCMGARFFDIRVTWKGGVMRMVHPLGKEHHFETWAAVLAQFKLFAEDPEHKGELIFPRVKCAKGTKKWTGDKCFKILDKAMDELSSVLVKPADVLPDTHNINHDRLVAMKWKDIHRVDGQDAPTKNVVLSAYPSKRSRNLAREMKLTKPANSITKLETNVWNYAGYQSGEFSKARDLAPMTKGQQEKVDDWESDDRSAVHGYWYTSTAEWLWGDSSNVCFNTAPLWEKASKSERSIIRKLAWSQAIGNVLIVDWVGVSYHHKGKAGTVKSNTNVDVPNWSTIMDIVDHYNTNGLPPAPVQDDNEEQFVEREAQTHPLRSQLKRKLRQLEP